MKNVRSILRLDCCLLLLCPLLAGAGGAMAQGHASGPVLTVLGDPDPRRQEPPPVAEAADETPGQETETEEPKWDVAEPPGEWGWHEVPIDVEVPPGTTRVRLTLHLVLNLTRR